MFKHLIFAAATAVSLTVAVAVGGDDPSNDKRGPATTQSSEMVNKFCAVEQEHPVDPKVFVIYKDKKVGFCCKDCIEPFQADPEKYMKDLK
jgi:hypothetical protein